MKSNFLPTWLEHIWCRELLPGDSLLYLGRRISIAYGEVVTILNLDEKIYRHEKLNKNKIID